MGSYLIGGPVEFTCYHECRQEGCPTHQLTVHYKAGGTYRVFRDGQHLADYPSDVIDALCEALTTARHDHKPQHLV